MERPQQKPHSSGPLPLPSTMVLHPMEPVGCAGPGHTAGCYVRWVLASTEGVLLAGTSSRSFPCRRLGPALKRHMSTHHYTPFPPKIEVQVPVAMKGTLVEGSLLVHVCVCLCVTECVSVYVSVSVYISVCLCMSLCVCLHVCVFVCLCICMYLCV